jgi:ribosomal protein S18 acetylase RimI-like enzyme
MLPTIRPMTAADLPAAADVILRGGWGDRRATLAFAVGHPACRLIVAEIDGEIVGTGQAAIHGPVGWVGNIFVAPERRRQGLGRALTERTIAELEAASCRSLVLVATEQGRPLYEGMGFEVVSWYHTHRASGLPPASPDPEIRPLARSDLAAAKALDRTATGEDRGPLYEAFVGREAGWALVAEDGTLRALVQRAPWGGGATIAADPAHALRLLDHRRRLAGPDGEVKVGVLSENARGRELLARAGWTEAWTAPRLARGDPLDWRPEMIWGQFNHALG